MSIKSVVIRAISLILKIPVRVPLPSYSNLRHLHNLRYLMNRHCCLRRPYPNPKVNHNHVEISPQVNHHRYHFYLSWPMNLTLCHIPDPLHQHPVGKSFVFFLHPLLRASFFGDPYLLVGFLKKYNFINSNVDLI